jgi:hypothetical protein
MKTGRIDSDGANRFAQELRGELMVIDDRTDQEPIFTIYKHSGSPLIVSDTECERLTGPAHSLSKTRIFHEVMDQFRVHGLGPKPSFCSQPD